MKQSTIDEWAAKLEHTRRPAAEKTIINQEQLADLKKLIKTCRTDSGRGVVSMRKIAGLAEEMLGTFVGRFVVERLAKEMDLD